MSEQSTARGPCAVVAVCNQKGGCGKSTTAASLAAGAAYKGFNSLLIDLDSQCNSSETFVGDPVILMRDSVLTILDVLRDRQPLERVIQYHPGRFRGRFGVVPGHLRVDQAEAAFESQLSLRVLQDELSDVEKGEERIRFLRGLRVAIDEVRSDFDLVVLDTPPSLGFLLTSALIAADYYLIPFAGSKFNLDALDRLTTTTSKIRERFNPNLQLLGLLFTLVDERTRIDRQVQELVKENYGPDLFETFISYAVPHREAPFRRESIFEYVPGEKAALQYEALVDEVFRRVAERGVRPRAQEVSNV
ncbi:MAG: ParA family protein [Dehalococcoidia bacterium]